MSGKSLFTLRFIKIAERKRQLPGAYVAGIVHIYLALHERQKKNILTYQFMLGINDFLYDMFIQIGETNPITNYIDNIPSPW